MTALPTMKPALLPSAQPSRSLLADCDPVVGIPVAVAVGIEEVGSVVVRISAGVESRDRRGGCGGGWGPRRSLGRDQRGGMKGGRGKWLQ